MLSGYTGSDFVTKEKVVVSFLLVAGCHLQVVDSLVVAGGWLRVVSRLRTTDFQQPTTHDPQPTSYGPPLFLAHVPATAIVTSVSELEDRWRRCPRWGRSFGGRPGSAQKIKRTKSQRARLNLNPLSHQPPRSGEVALPPPALAQSGGLVPVGSRCFRQGAPGKQTDPPEHRLLDLPLVPCDGARVV